MDYGIEGYIRCIVCRAEYKCHLGEAGGYATSSRRIYCNNCGEVGAKWEQEDWPSPQHTPPTWPPVGSHVTNVLEFPSYGTHAAER